ncbi:DUF6160 family protein [Marinobacter sp. G11]|jgi:hypothetical protein|uniref:DUF6160 family protein n=1 Tax=Marinobacter sp. G11 TaxID=2903522 RepID=UPI001E4EE9AA|nr:DUF6160 family protein [Marinobacter sp. G11]MCE0757595.1 DUF6160 family protein [Marinobacter sp. G11]
MKSLKKSALVLAMAGLPFVAQADLKPIDDAQMGSITGQAGVTIELETRVDIGEFRYTDEGSLSIKDISIGGANTTELFTEIRDADQYGEANHNLLFGETSDLIDNIKINIDIADDGDAIISVRPLTIAPIDFGVSTGEWTLEGHTDSTLLASNFNMVGAVNELEIRVDTETDHLNLATQVGISDLDVDVNLLGIGIRDFKMTGANYMGTRIDNGQPGKASVSYLGAKIDLDVYKGARFGSTDEALAIDLKQFDADMKIGQILVGGTNIGSVMLDNLSVQNTSMRIYGHD